MPAQDNYCIGQHRTALREKSERTFQDKVCPGHTISRTGEFSYIIDMASSLSYAAPENKEKSAEMNTKICPKLITGVQEWLCPNYVFWI